MNRTEPSPKSEVDAAGVVARRRKLHGHVGHRAPGIIIPPLIAAQVRVFGVETWL